jgi:gluconokinase
VHARTGAPIHSTFFPAKLAWLREDRPEIFARRATWCGFAEYLLWRLTGQLKVSLSMASGTGLLDQRAGTWDTRCSRQCDIGRDRLPPIDDAPSSVSRPTSSRDGPGSRACRGCPERGTAPAPTWGWTARPQSASP